MSEDTTKVDSTTNSQGSENKGTEEVKVDYKVELETAKAKLTKAEFTIEKLKKDLKSNNTKDDEGVESDTEEDIDERATKIAEVVSQKVRQEAVQDTISEEISKRAESPEHAELLKLYYDKRIVKTGFSKQSIAEDLDAAALLVNKPKIEAAMKELKQKAISNSTKGGSGQVTGQAEKPSEELNLSDADRRVMQRFGLKEEDINK